MVSDSWRNDARIFARSKIFMTNGAFCDVASALLGDEF